MARGINKIFLMGHIGSDPILRTTPTGNTVVILNLYTGETWKDKNTGEHKIISERHRIVFFKKLAEIAHQLLHKGTKIHVLGKLHHNSWTDKHGIQRITSEVIVQELEYLEGAEKAEKNKGGTSAKQEEEELLPLGEEYDSDPDNLL